MNPNPTIDNKILVCQFTFNRFDDRKVWYDVVNKQYTVTDKYGVAPSELVSNIFNSKQEIVNYYKKLNHTVFLTEDSSEKLYTPQLNIVKY